MGATKILFQNPLNPWSHTQFGISIAAACELFERTARRYGKPEWDLHDTEVNGIRTPVEVRTIWEKPFCRLLNFDRKFTRSLRHPQPRVLIVAPMSGHYATLLRGTVEAFLPTHEVYITDWSDARMVPLSDGRFDLDDYIDYVIEMLHALGGNMHIIAVCQPSVPVLAAVSLMEAARDPFTPISMTLMGGLIDTRRNGGPGFKGGFVGCSVEAGNVVQNSRAEFDPRAMFGPRDRIGRVQRPRLRLLQIFEDHGGFEDRVLADDEHRRLAERRNPQEPVRLEGFRSDHG